MKPSTSKHSQHHGNANAYGRFLLKIYIYQWCQCITKPVCFLWNLFKRISEEKEWFHGWLWDASLRKVEFITWDGSCHVRLRVREVSAYWSIFLCGGRGVFTIRDSTKKINPHLLPCVSSRFLCFYFCTPFKLIPLGCFVKCVSVLITLFVSSKAIQ